MKKKELKQLVEKLKGDIVTLVTKPESPEALLIKGLILLQLDFERQVMSGDKTDTPPIKSGEDVIKNLPNRPKISPCAAHDNQTE